MIEVNKRQRANAIEALTVMWPSVPPKNVSHNLSDWRQDRAFFWSEKATKPTCHSIACFGGWCAWWPTFRKQGVRADDMGAPYMRDGLSHSARVAAEFLFGDDSIFDLRRAREISWRITDHELVEVRLRNLIDNSVVVDEE